MLKLLLITFTVGISLFAGNINIKKFDMEADKIDKKVKKIESFIRRREKLNTTYEAFDKYKHSRYIFKKDILFIKISYNDDNKTPEEKIYYSSDDEKMKTISYVDNGVIFYERYSCKGSMIFKRTFWDGKKSEERYYLNGKKIKNVNYYEQKIELTYPLLHKKDNALFKFKDSDTDISEYRNNYEKRDKNNIYLKYSEENKKVYEIRYKNKDNFTVNYLTSYPMTYIVENGKLKKEVYYNNVNRAKRREVIYKNNGETLVLGYSENMSIKYKDIYRNGELIYLKINGLNGSETFYKNGEKIKVNYYTGKNLDMEIWYKNNKVIREKKYYDGKLESEIIYNNNEYVKINYYKGVLEYKLFSRQYENLYKSYYKKISYYDDGNIKSIFIPEKYPKTINAYKDTIKYIKKNKIDSGMYIEYMSLSNGRHTEFYKNGKKKHFYKKAYRRIIGKEIFYSRTGNVSYYIIHLSNGDKDKIKVFDSKQKIQFTGYYKNNKIYDAGTRKLFSGTIYIYGKKDAVEHKKIYKNGEITTHIEYRDDNLKFRETYYADKGIVKDIYYRENQNIWSKEINKKDSYLYEEYYENGKLKLRKTLKVKEKYDRNGFITYKYEITGKNTYVITDYYSGTNIRQASRFYKSVEPVCKRYRSLNWFYCFGKLVKYAGYNEKGDIAMEEIYDSNGKKTVIYDENGNIINQ